MSVPQSIRIAYDKVAPALREVKAYVESTMRPFCDRSKYPFFGRIKQVESLSEKLEGGRYSSWSEIDDLYACTIVVPSPAHESSIREKLSSSFAEQRVRSRATLQMAPDVFRFDGFRWYGTLRADTLAGRHQPGLDSVTFEVQVPTAFEYAWSTVTHDLVYKSNDVDWKRLRLAAQLKAAVEQIEVVIAAFDQTSSAVRATRWPETSSKQEIVSKFQGWVARGLIPETLVPASWRRFADNIFSLVRTYEPNPNRQAKAVSRLLMELEKALQGLGPAGLPYSGTLFQFVVSVVCREDTPGSVDNFVVVESPELRDFYGAVNFVKPFDFG